MREQIYQIRMAAVTYTNREGWSCARQANDFAVRAMGPRHAAVIARSILLSAADSDSDAKAFFGMLDEDGSYFSETTSVE